jgi:glycosyltransferase involved in cell wall biosynthesis
MAARKDIITQKETWIALLGRRDTPVDGVEDYCTFLGRALGARGSELKLARVPWIENGWIAALRWLAHESAAWRGKWVIVQYTALSWSRHGFPVFALAVLAVLRRGGARVAVVFHEPMRQGGSRLLDRFRGACQDWVIRKLYRGATTAIFADPLETIAWLPKNDAKAAFIPIGGNIPEPAPRQEVSAVQDGAAKTVAVFCVGDPPYREREVADIAHAIRIAVTNGSKIRLVFVGRGTEEARQEIDRAFEAVPAQISNLGLQSADEVSRILASSNAMLCVRGKLFSRRGSALAGVACGLPIIGYAGAAEGTHLAEAGVELVPYGDREALGAALTRVLRDSSRWQELRRRSLCAQEKYFSWDKIAESFMNALGAKRT